MHATSAAADSPALPRLLTANELAERLGISVWQVHEWTRSRGLPAVKVGRHYRYVPDRVREWLDAGGDA